MDRGFWESFNPMIEFVFKETAILVKLKPPHTERLRHSTVSSLGVTMLLAGCSSAEPVSSSGCTSKLLFFHRISKQ